VIVAIDTNVIVYAMTGGPKVQVPAHAWLDRLDSLGALLVTSGLARLECLVRPRRLGRPDEEAMFAQFFERVFVVPVSDDVLDVAATIRGEKRSLRTPDAIHLATAQVTQADLFLTGDRRLKSFKPLKVVSVLVDPPNLIDVS
jgi:predicted nucleic acid-binding protein